MKIKTFMAACILATSAAAAAPAAALDSHISGHTRDGTNIMGVAAYGDWVLQSTDLATYGAYFGQSAGALGQRLVRDTAIGLAALSRATNCTDCVAIGTRVGQDWRNATGWVQIGDAFAYTNGYLNIKAPSNGYNIGGVVKDAYGEVGIYNEGDAVATFGTWGTHIVGNLAVVPGNGTGQNGDIEASAVNVARATFRGGASEATLYWDGEHFCVEVGGTFLGYLTITPPAAGNQ